MEQPDTEIGRSEPKPAAREYPIHQMPDRCFMKRSTAYILLALLLTAPGGLQSEEQKEDESFKKASSYFFKKNFDMAESLLLQVIEKNPEHALAHAYLGDIFLMKKRYDGALDLYKKSIELDPAPGENYFRIGQIYYYKKNGSMAIMYFKKALAADEKLKFARYHLGLTYLVIMRDKDNTIQNWEAYIGMAPEDPQYENIKRAIELLRDPNFILPPQDSDISIEEALMLGGTTLDRIKRSSTDQEAGHETKKTKRKTEDIYLDDDLK